MIWSTLIFVCILDLGSPASTTTDEDFSIVYHFDNFACRSTLSSKPGTTKAVPKYVVESIEQTSRFNHGKGNGRIILLTNAKECGITSLNPSSFSSKDKEELSKRVSLVDIHEIESKETRQFVESSKTSVRNYQSRGMIVFVHV